MAFLFHSHADPLAGQSSDSDRPSTFRPREHLESLIVKHGYPTPVSLSSLRDLTATSSTYTPPSPRRPYHPDAIPIDTFESLSLSSATRPIPIPRRSSSIYEEDLPVTPLTGRFDHDDYFDDWERASQSARSRHIPSPIQSNRSGRYSSRLPPPRTRMRSDSSPFYSPVASPVMSPRRSTSPQPPRSRTQNTAKPKPMQGFHLGNLPRFHPAVYQPNTTTPTTGPPSPRQSRQPTYRTSASSRDMIWQYREFMENTHQGPSAPRLDPLVSPGPVTPLALEAGDYLTSGSVNNTSERTPRDVPKNPGPPPELVEKLIAYEEKAQKARKTAKGR